MNTRIVSIIGLVILAIVIFLGGMFFGQTQTSAAAFFPGGMMFANNADDKVAGHNMMGNAGMMNGSFDMMGSGSGMMNGGYGMMGNRSAMMNGGYGMMGDGSGMMAGNMMGGSGFDNLAGVEPLSIADAEIATSEYLISLANDDLTLGEIMIFDNHAYAQILDKSSDSGAFEVLVDPVSRNVYPEPGPNMMWNTEYSPMSGFGDGGMMSGMMGNGMMAGNMMGGFATDAEISVTSEEAIASAQRFLDAHLSGTMADETADTFPGYYTIHTLRDGETSGMLSVNAYTGQVFIHQWHGDFVEMAGEEHG